MDHCEKAGAEPNSCPVVLDLTANGATASGKRRRPKARPARTLESRMAAEIEYPPVTDELLEEAVDRIRTVGAPKRIVLFGSRARGEARPDSDLDLLIIEESDLPRYRRSGRYRRALLGLFPSKDIVVWTPEEVAEWQSVPNAFITSILAEGKTLYPR